MLDLLLLFDVASGTSKTANAGIHADNGTGDSTAAYCQIRNVPSCTRTSLAETTADTTELRKAQKQQIC